MKAMKKITALVLMLVMALSLAACAGSGEKTYGVAIYKYDDTFMTGVRNSIEAAASEKQVKVDAQDSQNKQPTQNDQVDAFITKKLNALIINPVDRTAAAPLIDKAKAANIPIVFINREPLPEDMNKWDQVYYVGAKAEESGTMNGELIVDYWNNNPEADKNGDGVLQYIMLTGEPGHQDATLRTQYSVEAITNAGIQVEKLAEDTAMWDKAKAVDKMAGFIANYGDKIEAVLANNDDMALGAIAALKSAGYMTGDKFVPVVGVDATAPALEALENGELLGTVLNDGKNQGKAALNIAVAASEKKPITKENIGYDVTDGKYVWIPYRQITKENINDAK